MTSKQRPKQKEVGDQVLWLLREGRSRQQEQQGEDKAETEVAGEVAAGQRGWGGAGEGEGEGEEEEETVGGAAGSGGP